MNCPACKSTQLSIAERQGIEIDYCPACRGVWLDRGELDKLIERAAAEEARYAAAGQGQPAAAPPPQPPPPQYQHPHPQHPPPPHYNPNDDSHYGYHYGKPYKKRKSWLHEIFD